MIGLTVRAADGLALSFAHPPRTLRPESRPWLALPARLDVSVVLAVAGTWLGWQAAVSMGLLSVIAALICRRTSGVTLAVGSVGVQFLTWRLQADFAPWWPGPHTAWWLFIVWVPVILAGVVAGRRLLPVTATPETVPSAASPKGRAPLPESATPAADSAVDS
jgi:hypothetical protein